MAMMAAASMAHDNGFHMYCRWERRRAMQGGMSANDSYTV